MFTLHSLKIPLKALKIPHCEQVGWGDAYACCLCAKPPSAPRAGPQELPHACGLPVSLGAAAQEHPAGLDADRGRYDPTNIARLNGRPRAPGLCKRLWMSLLGYEVYGNEKDLRSWIRNPAQTTRWRRSIWKRLQQKYLKNKDIVKKKYICFLVCLCLEEVQPRLKDWQHPSSLREGII